MCFRDSSECQDCGSLFFPCICCCLCSYECFYNCCFKEKNDGKIYFHPMCWPGFCCGCPAPCIPKPASFNGAPQVEVMER